ncbi:14352_t:CDS:2, partial [Cetraspora pellucida]
ININDSNNVNNYKSIKAALTRDDKKSVGKLMSIGSENNVDIGFSDSSGKTGDIKSIDSSDKTVMKNQYENLCWTSPKISDLETRIIWSSGSS